MSPSSSLDEQMVTVAPSRVWGSPGSHSHTVQFYEADGALLDELGRYIGSALGTGDAAVVVATEEHRRGLDARLRAWGIDVGGARAYGRYVSLDAAETLAKCAPDGWPDAVRFFDLIGGVLDRAAAAATANRPRVAVFGELVALLSARGDHEAAIYLEGLWNELAKTHSFSLYCAYPIDCFGREAGSHTIARICATHSQVVPGDRSGGAPPRGPSPSRSACWPPWPSGASANWSSGSTCASPPSAPAYPRT